MKERERFLFKLRRPTIAKSAATQAKEQQKAEFETTTDLSREAVAEVSTALRQLLADTFALYLKTKNFHWHMTGRHLSAWPVPKLYARDHTPFASLNRSHFSRRPP